jgi:sporulation protein YlmC with PRC-barrel domain
VTDDRPVSWLLIEPGWRVVTSDGADVGKVHEVVGDTGKDIFDGLAVSSGLLGKPRYVPAERVRSITEGHIEVELADPEQLEEYEEPPPSEEIIPVGSSRWDRLRGFFRGR